MRRRTTLLLLLVLLAVAFYGGRSMIARTLLYPAPLFSVGSPPPLLDEIAFDLANGDHVVGWAYRHVSEEAAGAPPAILLLHGNGENLETMRHSGIYERFQELRVHFLAIDYPGYGRSTGRPSEKSLAAAARVGLARLRDRQPDSPVVIFGWSLGAAVGIQVAAREEGLLNGLILASPWATLPDLVGSFLPRWLLEISLLERYDSLGAAPKVGCPVLVLHGRHDRIVPIEHGRRLFQALPPGTRWHELPGAGHNDLLGQPDVWREIADFLESVR